MIIFFTFPLKLKEFISDLICLFLSFTFFSAAIVKFLNIYFFHNWMERAFIFKLFPSFFTYFIPLVELLISASILFRRYRLVGLYFTLLFLVLFEVYMMLLSGQNMPFFMPFDGMFKLGGWRREINLTILMICLVFLDILILEAKKISLKSDIKSDVSKILRNTSSPALIKQKTKGEAENL